MALRAGHPELRAVQMKHSNNLVLTAWGLGSGPVIVLFQGILKYKCWVCLSFRNLGQVTEPHCQNSLIIISTLAIQA